MYYYFSEDTNCVLLLREMVSINDRSLKKVVRKVLEKNHHFAFWDISEGLLFSELQCSYSYG
jgi:hypothetical protein